jgi:hypothetical protein
MPKFDKNFYTIITIAIILFVAINYFVTKPIIYDIVSKYKTISQKDQELVNLQEEMNSDIKLSQNKNIINDMYYKMALFLPENIASGDFVSQVEEMANLTNQNLTDITIKQKEQKTTTDETDSTTNKTTSSTSSSAADQSSSNLKQNNFSITESGSFPDLINFMSSMQKMDRLHSIQSMALNINSDNSLETKLDGTIYYKPQITFTGNAVLSSKDEQDVNNINHYGEIIIPSSTSSQGRANPFVNP